MTENSHKGHRQRLKKRFLQEGLDRFEMHNVLELLLFFGVPYQDTNETAHNLLKEFGSFSAALDAPYEALLEVKGISEHSATLLKMVPELSRLYQQDKQQHIKVLDTSRKIGEFFLPKFIGRTEEVVYILCLDNSLRVLNCQMLFHGTINAASVSIRKIAETAFRYQCANVVIAHNHPAGQAVASNEDIITTDSINYALKLTGIKLLDHIIVADNKYISMAELGQLTNLWKA